MPAVRVTLSCEIDPDLYNEKMSQGWTEKDFIDEVLEEMLNREYKMVSDIEVFERPKFIKEVDKYGD